MINEKHSNAYYFFIIFFLLSQIVLSLIGAYTVVRFIFKPAKLLSPLPDEKKCIELNYKLNQNNNETRKPASTTSKITTTTENIRESNTAIASYYTTEYCQKYNPDCLTASGQIFTDEGLTAACANRFKLGTRITLSVGDSSVTVVCNDRGSFEEGYGRMFDLTKTAFNQLAPLSKGVVNVTYKVIN